MPSLEGGTDWFNSAPLTNNDFVGHPALIHFWAISCHSCKESLPDINRWLEQYAEKGLKILSVHMPRQESDTNVEAVKEAVRNIKSNSPAWWTTGTALQMLLKINMFLLFIYLIKKANCDIFRRGKKQLKWLSLLLSGCFLKVKSLPRKSLINVAASTNKEIASSL